MRFKKLRLSVGIALVLFILIVGNIIVFGKLADNSYMSQSNNTDQNSILVDSKQIASKETQTETNPIQSVDEVQDSSPPVVHHSRRTRAS